MIDRETWQFINSFAPWLAAFGTITAAGVALYLARRNIRLNLRLKIFNESSDIVGKAFGESDINDFKSYLTLRIVNDGFREVLITKVRWVDGWVSKAWCDLIRHDDSSTVPCRLRDGDEMLVRYDPERFYNYFLKESPSLRNPQIKRRILVIERVIHKCSFWPSLRAMVITSTGKTFSLRFPRSVVIGFAKWHGLE